MKVKITKALTPKGEHFFYLYVNGDYFKSFYFDPEAEEQNYSSESSAYARVKEMADNIEKMNGLKDIEETVYESK